jgi:DNA-binding beta-propeller fold protein YncE
MRSRTTRILAAAIGTAMVSAVPAGAGTSAANAAAAAHAAAATTPPPATLYVLEGDMYWINTATNKVDKVVGFSGAPAVIVLGPGGKTAYVLLSKNEVDRPWSVISVNTATGQAGKAMATGDGFNYRTSNLAITPDGKTIYVVDAPTDEVIPASTVTRKAGKPIKIGSDQDRLSDQIAITPNGKTAYVALGTEVIPISTATNRVGKPIKVAGGVGSFALTPNGATVYVLNSTDTVTPISTATNKPGKPIHVSGEPYSLAFTPNGKEAYVAAYQGGMVTPITVATGKTEKSIKIGGADTYAFDIAMASNGKTALVPIYLPGSPNSGSVVPITVATNKAGKPITIPDVQPTYVVITPNSRAAYAVGFDGVTGAGARLYRINVSALYAPLRRVNLPSYLIIDLEMYPSPTPWIPGS